MRPVRASIGGFRCADHRRSEIVPMMSIGKMVMPVPERRMPMQVGVSGTSRLRDLVSLLVMLVMFVHVFVLQWLVPMGVRMVLGKMEPHASCHQSARQHQRQGHRVAEQHSRRRPEERSDGEKRARACPAEMPQAHDE